MSPSGIMSGSSALTVDARDMLCAQALALVARAAAGLGVGAALEVRYSTPDVRQDLASWARDRGWRLVELEPGRVRLTRSGDPAT